MIKNPQAKKFIELSKAMFKAAPGEFTTIKAGDPGWHDWHHWRTKNGLSTNFMIMRGKYGVPSKYPPASSLETALEEYSAGTAAKKRI